MNFSELGRMIETLGRERGIAKGIIISAIEHAFLVTVRKKFGFQGEYETRYNEGESDVEIYQYKSVVKDGTVKDSTIEIEFDEAKELDADCEIGDQLGLKIENPTFSRVDVQSVKQAIFQKVRDAEREILFGEFKHREGDLITGIVRRYERGNVIVDLGKADGILPRRETIPGENFASGDRIQCYLSEVVMGNRGPEIRLTRASPMFMIKLFEVEVPEIQDSTIQIKSAAREPGYRSKMAVYTSDRDIDPVGACVGMRGSRVQNVINELQGEKIDIVPWNPDLKTFACSALAPAEITSIVHHRDNNSLDVIVEEDQLSLAIGRRGQNVRLAAMLTGCNVNIISKTKLQEKINRSVGNLLQIQPMTDALAQILVQSGVMNINDLLALEVGELVKICDFSQEKAEEFYKKAQEDSQRSDVQLTLEEDNEIVSASAIAGRSGFKDGEVGMGKPQDEKEKFQEAERRLREELAAFKLK